MAKCQVEMYVKQLRDFEEDMQKRRPDEDDGPEWGVEALPRRLVERQHPIRGGWTVVLTRSETK